MQRDAKFRKNINSDKWEVERIWGRELRGVGRGNMTKNCIKKFIVFFYICIINKIVAWFLSRKAKDKLKSNL